MIFKKGKTKEIKIRTNLNLPTVSNTIKLLKQRGWINEEVNEEEKPHGKGRPYKIYSLKVRNEKIVAEFRKHLEETHYETIKAIETLRKFNRKPSCQSGA